MTQADWMAAVESEVAAAAAPDGRESEVADGREGVEQVGLQSHSVENGNKIDFGVNSIGIQHASRSGDQCHSRV